MPIVELESFHSKDDILTMLVHLGYLGYDSEKKELFIPNKEVLDVFRTSTRNRDWTVTFRALQVRKDTGKIQVRHR